MPDGEVTPPDLFKYAGLHAPNLRLARFDGGWDTTQAQFAAVAGLPGGLREVLDVSEALAEDAGVPLDVLTAFVDGDTRGDVLCDGDCGRPPE